MRLNMITVAFGPSLLALPSLMDSATAFFQSSMSRSSFRYMGQAHPWSYRKFESEIHSSSNGNDSAVKRSSSAMAGEESPEDLLARARQLRLEIEDATSNEKTGTPSKIQQSNPIETEAKKSQWSALIPEEIEGKIAAMSEYRLYLDIGREKGTWMDPRWGASGKRIECTIDVIFALLDDGQCAALSAPAARLRNGFDRMACESGTFNVESSKKQRGSSTIRFSLGAEGTPETGSSYGDLHIPNGGLFFAMPCFGSTTAQQISNLSTKMGTVTVQQMGWNTGWRRRESRILGVFKAVPIEKAQQLDGF